LLVLHILEECSAIFRGHTVQEDSQHRMNGGDTSVPHLVHIHQLLLPVGDQPFTTHLSTLLFATTFALPGITQMACQPF